MHFNPLLIKTTLKTWTKDKLTCVVFCWHRMRYYDEWLIWLDRLYQIIMISDAVWLFSIIYALFVALEETRLGIIRLFFVSFDVLFYRFLKDWSQDLGSFTAQIKSTLSRYPQSLEKIIKKSSSWCFFHHLQVVLQHIFLDK